ncbi:MAG: nucleoside kinase [Marinilabiliaceae bacterium]|nr:nucleoside kinase [Marinilabiliaceae bacterium]
MTQQKIKIKCLNNNTTKSYHKSITLREIADDQHIQLKAPILGALVNNHMADLAYEVYHPKQIRFVDVTHPDGMRMYMRSLCFVLYKAVNDLFPGAKLTIEHSVSKGIYCEIKKDDRKEIDIQEVFAIGQRMREIVEMNIPFIKDQRETNEVIDILEAQHLTDKSDILRHRGKMYTSFYWLDTLANHFYGYLVPSTGYLQVFDLNKYYKGMLLQLPRTDNPEEVAELIIQDKMFDIFREHAQWNRVLNITHVGHLNQAHNGKSETIIKVSEALHEKKISQIADKIANHHNKLKIVLISGPSSSGKTTFSKRLAIQLLVSGIAPVNLSLDNYFVDREHTPLDENGDYDFEALEALDIDLFNQNLIDLLDGKKVEIPKFSFQTGQRVYDGEVLQLHENNILIIEGIHALNPQLTHLIDASAKFKIYISALTTINLDDHNRINTTDNRLVRRIVRDYKYRKYSAQETISRWPSVRRGEDKHIFPYQEEADVMINTALLYELAVLKPLVEPILLEVQPNQPEYSEAKRLLKFFSYFKPILRINEIPPTSILREFVGGSSFSY